MHVLLAVNSLGSDYGGPAESVPRLAFGLWKQGLEVSVFAGDGTDSSILSGTGVSKLVSLSELKKKVDVVHSNGVWRFHNQVVVRFAQTQKAQLVLSPRGMLEPWSLKQNRIRKQLAWWLYQKKAVCSASVLHATSELESQNLLRLVPEANVVVIPNGVSMPTTDLCSGGEGGDRTALFLSRIHPKKGIELLMESWSEVRPTGWVLKLYGPDSDGYGQKIKKDIERLGLEGCVELLPPVFGSEKSAVMQNADVFVLPSFSENFGNVVPEALSHGVPVITTTGTPWSIIRDARCGWWVCPTKTGLSEAIAEATNMSDSQLNEMGKRGMELVVDRFSWETVSEQFTKLYQELVQ